MQPTTIRKIPLDRLELSPKNARRAMAPKEDANALKASLLAQGLRQNLNVERLGEKGKERFLVVAGGRRLLALQALAAEKRIKPDFAVPCTVVDADKAVEISLAENAVRLAMHPADEFEAFARVVEAGSTIEQVATRFGVSPLHVERRLKLGKLHPELLEAYRAGELTLEAAKALTLTSDHKRQMEAWEATEQERRYGGGVQHMIRRLLTSDGLSSRTRIGRLVDVTAYEAAGGAIHRDLFGVPHQCDEEVELRFEDEALARRIAAEVLEKVAEPLRDEWKWVEVDLEPELYRQGWSRLHSVPIDPPTETVAALEALARREIELEGTDEDDWTDELGEEMDALYERRAELERDLALSRGFTPEQKAASGCIVGAGHDGPMIAEAILRPDDIAALEAANRAATESAKTGPHLVDPEDENADGGDENAASTRATIVVPGQPEGIAASASAVENKVADDEGDGPATHGPIHSQSLAAELAAARHQILSAHVAGKFDVAFDVLLWQMVVQLMRSHRMTAMDLIVSRQQLSAKGPSYDDSPAARLMAAIEEALPRGFVDLEDAEAFEAMCDLPAEDKQVLFAWCVGQCMTASRNAVVEAIGTRLDIDVAKFWRPTAETYWSRVRKDVSLDVAREVLGPDWAHARKDQTKPVLAKSMETVFADGKGIGLADDELARARTWLPEGMAFAAEKTGPASSAEGDHAMGGGASDDVEDVSEEAEDDIIVPAFLRTGEAA